MKRDILFYRRAYEDTSQNALWQYMLEYLVSAYTKLAESMVENGTLNSQVRFGIRLYCYGAVGMTREWVLQDNITPAEVLARMMFESMPEGLKAIYFPDGSF